MRRTVITTLIVLVVLLMLPFQGHSQSNGGSGGPSIGTPITTPSSPGSGDQVIVNVTVMTSPGSPGVQSVMIAYTTDNWASNQTVSAPYVPRFDDYQGSIPAQPQGTHVSYYVVAVDAASNTSVNNNSGSYFSYTVGAGTIGGGGGGGSFNITSTSLWLIAAILGAIMVGMLVVFKRRSGPSKPSKNKP